MARPQRNNVDYFPFLCEDGQKMHYIEQTYGNDGFAVFVKLLRELAKKDFHYLNLSDKPAKMFLASKCRVSIEVLTAIIEDLVSLGKFDKVLWNENNIVWCQDFIDSVQDAYLKRNNKCITYEGLLTLLQSLGVRKPIKSTDKGRRNTQSKEEDSKVKESKEEETIIYPFDSLEFISLWQKWKDHRWVADKFKYKTAESEQAALSELSNLSNTVEEVAKKIILQSMAKGWKGFFPLKTENNGTSQQSTGQSAIEGAMAQQAKRKAEREANLFSNTGR